MCAAWFQVRWGGLSLAELCSDFRLGALVPSSLVALPFVIGPVHPPAVGVCRAALLQLWHLLLSPFCRFCCCCIRFCRVFHSLLPGRCCLCVWCLLVCGGSLCLRWLVVGHVLLWAFGCWLAPSCAGVFPAAGSTCVLLGVALSAWVAGSSGAASPAVTVSFAAVCFGPGSARIASSLASSGRCRLLAPSPQSSGGLGVARCCCWQSVRCRLGAHGSVSGSYGGGI